MGKYDKYFCTTLHKRDRLPGPSPDERDKMAAEGVRYFMEHILWIDDDIIPGAYYGELTWNWPASYPNLASFGYLRENTTNMAPMFPHAHDFPELLSWWGSDPDDPDDMNSMGMIMGDEEVPLPTSWVGYIPAGMMHMPTRRADGKPATKPVSHWTSGPGVYTRGTEGDDVKAAEQKELPVPGKPKLSTQETLKYFIFPGQKDIIRPSYMRPYDPALMRPMAYIDEKVIPDCEFGCDTMFLMPDGAKASGELLMEAHTLPHGTSITLNALNFDDITDLCAEAELWIGGEKHVITKGFGAYIPPGVEQGPFIIRNMTKQMFLMISHPVGEGIKKYPGGK
ncbi:MAG: hypothetical protein MUO19_09250 [Dehalococcoidales bacterium]|nr:hypothetical protein [Dehalococcoidales bacterium]